MPTLEPKSSIPRTSPQSAPPPESERTWAVAEKYGDKLQAWMLDHAASFAKNSVVLLLVGVAASVLLGAVLFVAVASAYRRKRVSEQWLLIASVWLFFALAVASGQSPEIRITGNLVAVGLFALVARTGWARIPHPAGPGARLLLLRSFTLGERSNRLFQQFESLWRSVGSVQLVGGVDLALSTLEPHELLDYFRRRLGREFVHSAAGVDERLRTFDHDRDPDGRYRVNVLFCRGDATWKYAVKRLVPESDCVLIDLRGFSRHRSGCVFEIRTLAELSASRVVFLVDAVTDRDFVRETWSAGRAARTGESADAEPLRFVPEAPLKTAPERIIDACSNRAEVATAHR